VSLDSTSPPVLIVRLDAIGDALTTVPLIAALRLAGFRVGAVLRPVNAKIFSARALDRIHVVDGDAGYRQEIRRESYGIALIPTEKPLAYRIARDARIPVRIGFENGWGKPLKTLWVRRMCTQTIFRTAGLDSRAPHECEVVFKLAASLLPYAEPPRDPAVLREIVLDQMPAPDTRIAMQITRKWERLGASIEHVREVYRRAAQQREVRLIGSESEAEYCDRFAEAAGVSVERFDSLSSWKNAIAAARAVLAPDSGAVHVAGMIGTPVVACFAHEHFTVQSSRWAPWAAPHAVVAMQNDAWPLAAADALESLLSGREDVEYKG
jgi:ADP-heptose:LPS heptosyltransferase